MKKNRPGLLLACLAISLAACSGRSAESSATAAADLSAAGTVWTAVDGNRMPYDITGDGEVTVLLVHCWMCDRSFWDKQVPVLARHYRTIAVDLPGHGGATADRESWTVAQYGEDVAGLINGLNLSDVILVGHSMGGPVSLRAAALSGDRVRGIVAVDTLHDAEFEFSGEQIETFIKAFEADFVATCNQFVEQMFPEADAREPMNRVQEASCHGSRSRTGIALMKDFGAIDMKRWFEDAGVPIRAINAAQPNPTRTASNRKYAEFDAVLMDGVGHYPHMTRPEEFNRLLLEAIAELTNGS
jgi:pimeloyl-ACP methyl ester carboxylesterase